MKKILAGTVIGALFGCVVVPLSISLLLGIAGTIRSGLSGLWLGISGGLYYSMFFGLFFGLIPGAIIGAAITVSRMVGRQLIPTQLPPLKPTQQPVEHSQRIAFTVIGLIIGVVLALSTLTYLFTYQIGVKRSVTHTMRWVLGDGNCNDQGQIVYLVYAEFPHFYEQFCSDTLAAYLRQHTSSTVVVTFEATYDFGSLRGYHIQQIDDYPSTLPDGWTGGGGGCGDTFLPPCRSGSGTDDSPWK